MRVTPSPRGKSFISLYQPIYSSPYTHFSDVPPCGGDNQCIKRLSWTKAARACFTLLKIPFEKSSALEIIKTVEEEDENMVYGYWQRESAVSPSEGI